MAKKTSTSVYVFALLLFLGGVGALTYAGLSEESVYFMNVSEVLRSPAGSVKTARVFGTVSASGLARSTDGRTLHFRLEDGESPTAMLAVSYSGVVPDVFKAGAEVIVEGGLRDGGVFHATTLMTKCPSKYQKENRKHS